MERQETMWYDRHPIAARPAVDRPCRDELIAYQRSSSLLEWYRCVFVLTRIPWQNISLTPSDRRPHGPGLLTEPTLTSETGESP